LGVSVGGRFLSERNRRAIRPTLHPRCVHDRAPGPTFKGALTTEGAAAADKTCERLLHGVASGIRVTQDRASDAPERAEPGSVEGFDVRKGDGLTPAHWEDDASAHAFLYRIEDV